MQVEIVFSRKDKTYETQIRICLHSCRKYCESNNFYEWFLERSAAKKGESLYLFDVDGFRLFLFDHNNENEEVKYGDNCLLSFEVDDARKTKEKIEDRNLKIVFSLTKIQNNLVFEFEDPEGNHIEVFSKVSASK